MNRRALIAGVAAAGAVLATGLYRFTDLFVKHYAPTPYDDVLTSLQDRARAAQLGAHVNDTPTPQALAARLRTILKPGLATVAKSDAVAGRLVEIDGWVVPESVALLSALAAKV